MGQVRRRRDPEARRRAIVTAAAELVTEVGVDAMTHRMVAARAGVPLGATTQYFDTLDDLRAAALAHLAEEIDARVDGVRVALEEQGASARSITRLLVAARAAARTHQADPAGVTAPGHAPSLRVRAPDVTARRTRLNAPVHGPRRAETAAIFIDGVLWHSLISDTPPDEPTIEAGLAAILGETGRSPGAADPSASDIPARAS